MQVLGDAKAKRIKRRCKILPNSKKGTGYNHQTYTFTYAAQKCWGKGAWGQDSQRIKKPSLPCNYSDGKDSPSIKVNDWRGREPT